MSVQQPQTLSDQQLDQALDLQVHNAFYTSQKTIEKIIEVYKMKIKLLQDSFLLQKDELVRLQELLKKHKIDYSKAVSNSPNRKQRREQDRKQKKAIKPKKE